MIVELITMGSGANTRYTYNPIYVHPVTIECVVWYTSIEELNKELSPHLPDKEIDYRIKSNLIIASSYEEEETPF